jgi:hypothetical protein
VQYKAEEGVEGLPEGLFLTMLWRVLHGMSVVRGGRVCRVVWWARGTGTPDETSWGAKAWKEYEFWGEAERTGLLADGKLDLDVQGWQTSVAERRLGGVQTTAVFWSSAAQQGMRAAGCEDGRDGGGSGAGEEEERGCDELATRGVVSCRHWAEVCEDAVQDMLNAEYVDGDLP